MMHWLERGPRWSKAHVPEEMIIRPDAGDEIPLRHEQVGVSRSRQAHWIDGPTGEHDTGHQLGVDAMEAADRSMIQ